MVVSKKRTIREKWRLTSLANKTITIATVVIAMAAVLQFGTALFQWLEMRNGGVQTDKIIAADQRIATAMEGSVAEAQITLDAANKQAMLSQRAWISISISPFMQQNAPPAFPILGRPFFERIIWKNTGRTPALHVRTVTRRQDVIEKNGQFGKPNFSYKKEDFLNFDNISPNDEIFNDELYPDDVVKKIINDQLLVYIDGRIEYDDVFGLHHWKNYCGTTLPNGGIRLCPYHNDVDNNQ